MKLELNVSAPKFKLPSVFANEVNLEEYRGKKVMIAFFRHAGCPFCNLRVHTLNKHYQEFRSKGLEMIFFFESPDDLIQRSTFHKDVSPIPIISDPQKVWYNTYGLEESSFISAKSHITSFLQTSIQAKLKGLPVHMMAGGESINTIPAEFLLDENLIIRRLHYSTSLTNRMAIADIQSFISSSKQGMAV
jgi:peroxiredoxin